MSTSTNEARSYRVPASSPWAGAWKIVGAVGVLGLLGAAYGYTANPDRFGFSYLFGVFVPLSLALGSLFFVMVIHITKAGWAISVRRIAEAFIRPMPLFAVLFIPLVLILPHMFPWLGARHVTETQESAQVEHKPGVSPLPEERGVQSKEPAAYRELPEVQPHRMDRAEEGAEHEIVEHKQFYLNKPFFLARLIVYLLVWAWLAHRYYQWSTEQDQTKAVQNTVAAQSFTPAGLILFAATLTFFGFDWFLSLDATWYSTIFGVYIFAQAALFQMACLILAAWALRRSKLLGDAVNVEHFHDMGKLLFGWIVFWSYIAFAQFFLTWYSNVPDELLWFHKRWNDNGGTWKTLSIAIVLLHFFVPFWFLMSRNVKRRLSLLAAGAVCMVVMHVIEVYWVIMPNYGPLAPNIVDLACLLGPLGIYLAVVLRGMQEHSLVPVGDPRLERALEFENA